MTTVLKFPKDNPRAAGRDHDLTPEGKPPAKAGSNVLVRVLWVVLALLWVPVKWVLSVDVFWQFLRMVYYWNDPAVHAGWTFAGHFALLVALTYFVMHHKPKGL